MADTTSTLEPPELTDHPTTHPTTDALDGELVPPPPTAIRPPSPPQRPPAPEPASSDRPARRRGFVLGVVTGVAVTALAVGGVALVRSGDDGSAADSPPATTVAASSDSGAATVTLVPADSSVHDLVVAVRPSIVAIHTTITQTDLFGQQLEGEAAGSGFVLSADGYVVTNNHVVDGADSISVTFDDGTTDAAELVGADPRSDLAVLHVDRTDLTPLAVGDSDAIQVGDPVVAIGNALDLGAEPTVTGGMISAKDRTITEPNGQVLVNLVQTDAAISPGNSGGPLIDLGGRVVGINTAVAGQGQNIGFAIAINPALDLIDQLRDGQVPRHALLGVSTRPTEDGTPGALVADVSIGSGAEAAGIRRGDVITEFDGDSVTTPSELVAAIARHQPGDEVEVVVRRDDSPKSVQVTLGAHDETNS